MGEGESERGIKKNWSKVQLVNSSALVTFPDLA